MIRALRRGAYLLAIDSFGQPLSSALAPLTTSFSESEESGYKEFVKQLQAAANNGSIGDSVIAIAASTSDRSGLRDGEWSAILDTESVTLPEQSRVHLSFVEYLRHCPDGSDVISGYLKNAVKITEHLLEPVAFLVALASLYRRTRPLTALQSIGATFLSLAHNGSPQDRLEQLDFGSNTFTITAIQTHFTDVALCLDALSKTDILIKPHGAIYWMHTAFRDLVYDRVPNLFSTQSDHIGSGLRRRARMHDAIATHYYRHIYLPSRDLHAFIEYLFHRVASVTDECDGLELIQKKGALAAADVTELIRRLRHLTVSLVRERQTLLAGRDPFQVADLLDDARVRVANGLKKLKLPESVRELQDEIVNACRELHLMRAEALRDGGKYSEAAGEYLFVSNIETTQRNNAAPLGTYCNAYLSKESQIITKALQFIPLGEEQNSELSAFIEAQACLCVPQSDVCTAPSNDWDASFGDLTVPTTERSRTEIRVKVRSVCRYLDLLLPSMVLLTNDQVSERRAFLKNYTDKISRLLDYGQGLARLLDDQDFGKYMGFLYSLRARWFQYHGNLGESRHCVDAAGSALRSGRTDASSILAVYRMLCAEQEFLEAKADGRPDRRRARLRGVVDHLRTARETLLSHRTYVTHWADVHILWALVALSMCDSFVTEVSIQQKKDEQLSNELIKSSNLIQLYFQMATTARDGLRRLGTANTALATHRVALRQHIQGELQDHHINALQGTFGHDIARQLTMDLQLLENLHPVEKPKPKASTGHHS